MRILYFQLKESRKRDFWSLQEHHLQDFKEDFKYSLGTIFERQVKNFERDLFRIRWTHEIAESKMKMTWNQTVLV